MYLIVKKTASNLFLFYKSSDGLTEDGQLIGGNDVKLSFSDDSLVIQVIEGERFQFKTSKLKYNDGSTILGFTSMIDFVETLKTAGFTGNFNTGGSSSLPTDVEDALLDANLPSATNPFATMDDIGSGGGGTIDAVPTDGSTNAVSSNGVFDALANKVDKVVGKSLISDTEIIRLASLFNNSNISTIEGFGDSITVGQGATNTNFAYINLVAQFIGKTLTNRALSGSGVWASARSHIQNINPNHSVMAFVMSGFNDTRRGGSNPLTRLKIMNSYRSILANHFLRNFITAGATDTRIVRANGAWQTTYTGLALGLKTNTGAFSSTNGATIEFTFSGNNIVLGMVAVKQSFETHATFTIHIDNTLIGTYNNNDQTDGISDGVYDNNRTQRVLIFDNLSESMHTIRLTNVSSNFLVVDYFGQLKQPKQSLPICIAKMPKMNAAGYATAPNLANDALIDSLNADIVSVCNEFRSKGYPVYIAETNDYYNVNTGLSADNIHPNNVGYTQIYNSIVAQIGDLIV